MKPRKPKATPSGRFSDPITMAKVVRRMCDLQWQIAECQEWVCPMRKAKNYGHGVWLEGIERNVAKFLQAIEREWRAGRTG